MHDIFEFQLNRDNLYEQVAEQIQALIVAESLRPGDRLPSERELAERLSISRTVVREAIRALDERGLVHVKPGCGTFVQEPSARAAAAPIELYMKLRQCPSFFANLYEVRSMIEVEIAGLAALRATSDDLAALKAAIEGMVRGESDADTYVAHDMDFHMALASAAHNDLFGVLLTPIADRVRKAIRVSYEAPGAYQAGLEHHRRVLRAIIARDYEEARRAMADHVRASDELVGRMRERLDERTAKQEGV